MHMHAHNRNTTHTHTHIDKYTTCTHNTIIDRLPRKSWGHVHTYPTRGTLSLPTHGQRCQRVPTILAGSQTTWDGPRPQDTPPRARPTTGMYARDERYFTVWFTGYDLLLNFVVQYSLRHRLSTSCVRGNSTLSAWSGPIGTVTAYAWVPTLQALEFVKFQTNHYIHWINGWWTK